MSEPIPVKPFIKWPGRKTSLLADLRRFYPTEPYGCYHEPFVGSGAVFFDAYNRGFIGKAILCDSNLDLVNTWIQVRDNLDNLLLHLRIHEEKHRERGKDHYYRVRAEAARTSLESAARMIYLNKTGFNGLYRVNASGQYNVPMGSYKNPNICDRLNLPLVSKSLQGIEILCEDYAKVLERAEAGDFVYLDPPYIPTSKTANFTSFTKEKFDHEEHVRLAGVMGTLAERGCNVVLSNSDTPKSRELYADHGYIITPVTSRRKISCLVSSRGMMEEIIVSNFKPQE